MKRLNLTLCSIFLPVYFLFASAGDVKIDGSSSVYFEKGKSFPVYVSLNKNTFVTPAGVESWLKTYLKNPSKNEIVPYFEWNSPSGISVIRYYQKYNGCRIDNSNLSVRFRDGRMISASANIFNDINITGPAKISEESALAIAINVVPAAEYRWQKNLSYYPEGDLEIVPVKTENGYVFNYAWKFDIYALKPLFRKSVWIDASSGKLIKTENRIKDADVSATAYTKYSGTQTITTDSYSGSFRLRESGRGGGIITYNMQNTADYGNAVDFTDSDNLWNNVNTAQDEVATDAHFASEKMYDYLNLTFSMNSIDNAGLPLVNYVHLSLVDLGYGNNVNAFWDGSSMNYGDGSTSVSPLTTLDIAGHEMMHGVTEFSSSLVYQDQSGALNEGFSDIFGTVLEFYAYPPNADWDIGEDIGTTMRSLQDPKSYNKPNTYMGDYWYTGSGDYGGVHTNCSVLGYWFYLVSQGGSGMNDIDSTYSVTGIGMTKAANIAFHLNTAYLLPDATYETTRFMAVQTAVDLYGPCTPEVEAVTDAMFAVGLGNRYVAQVVADFSTPLTDACQAPFNVSFTNYSNNASTFLWNFGDGQTSTDPNPVHTYNTSGNFTVSLNANGGACGSDILTETDYISISPANPCIVILPTAGTATTQTSCAGILYDYGGPSGNYLDNSDAVITIAPSGASNVILNISELNIEAGDNGTCNFDYLEIFDGPNTSSPSLGQYCNLTGNPGTITSTGSAVTIHFYSDQGLNLSGFAISWNCNLATAPPVAQFASDITQTCIGTIHFTDQSSNSPTSWLWEFGDGSTSTQQSPSYTYNSDGVYNVSLYVSNPYGADTLILNSYITVDLPSEPIVTGDTACINDPAVLTASGSGNINWYDSQTGGTLLYTGPVFTTAPITGNEVFYAENSETPGSLYVGSTESNTNGSYFTSQNVHYLIFNCIQPVTLVSVEVNAQSSGYREILLRNSSGTILETRNINIPAGVSRITLNMDIPVGNNLQLVGPESPGLYRNDNNINYPYNLPGYISIISSSAYPTPRYYYFYDWEVVGADCLSPRVPVYAYVDSCSGVEEYSDNIVLLFPSPANDFISFSSDFSGAVFSITDVSGKICKADLLKENKIEINDLSAGIYFLKINRNLSEINFRFVKN